MSAAPIDIRTMNEADLETALSWAAREGWNPGLDDLAPFHAADPHGFFMTCIEGEPAACISAVRSGETYGFIGFYICRPDLRGKGVGMATWHHAMAYLDGRTIGLDGVLEQQDNYRKSGFELAHRNIRHSGISLADTPMDPRICTIGRGLFPAISDYDRRFVAEARDDFLKIWCAPTVSSRRGFAFVEDGSVKGYGVIRQCQDGFKIGPLFADTAEIADTLFRALAGQAKGQTVILDTPEPNEAAMALAERYELSPVFETARMFKGPAPDLSLDRTYGITTFELG
ncbi:GNAT family N-acetyltransferase [Roseibium sp.]|uniref:GNAT family N-acetyltransferase n=1 Tax=Roseibium sp. TaxID=1936156 RepID=UPI003A97534E